MTEKKQGTSDPAEATKDLFEQSTVAGKAYVAALGEVTIAGLRTAIDLQNRVVDANRAFQAETLKMAEAGAKLAQDAFETKI
jgi:hypothetical protein